MPIITLTSDWGQKDAYAGAVKGAILSKMPEVTIVDISHQVPPYEIEQAAYILKNAYPNFPKGTIHIIGINTEESDKFAHTIVEVNNQYFIGNDNGIFSLLFDETPKRMVEITIPQDSDHFTFSSRDRFAKAAVHLAKGGLLKELGDPKTSIIEKILLKPVADPDVLKGHVIYIDTYEHLVTNISENMFNEIRQNRKFSIVFRSYEIKKICNSYTDVAPGEILALFGSNGNLEIAMNQGNAAGLLGLDYKDMIRIEFS